MSFSDMMESGRGPGVIGTLLALVVLSGFVLLYFFVFDEGMQGGPQAIESVIRQQAVEIETLNAQHKQLEEDLKMLPRLEASTRELATLARENRIREGQIKGLKENFRAATTELEETEKQFEAYKDEYRAFVRNKARGLEIPRLETSKGTYDKVSIREITAIGIQIRYDGGLKRIPYEELPADMQDYYQFDAKQKDDAVAVEAAHRNQHESDAAKADSVESVNMSERKVEAAQKDREKIQASISALEEKASALQNELRTLGMDRSRAASAAASARAKGRFVLDKTGEIDRNIASKRNRLAAMKLEISKLRSSL